MKTLLTLLVLAQPLPTRAQDVTKTSKHETVIKGMIQQLNELGEALESVKDKDSAKAAAVRINKVCDRMTELGKEAEGLPELSKAEDERLKKKYEADLRKVAERVQKVAFQAGAASGGEPDFLKSAMRLQEVGKALQGLDKKRLSKAEKIIGKWEPAKADPKAPGFTLEFTKDGKLKVSIALPGADKPLMIEGTYKVEGDKLTTTGKGPDGKEKTDTGTIKELTDSKLVIDKDGKTDEFKRKKQ
jgi:uncharacterized protein (TIGR03066 family)